MLQATQYTSNKYNLKFYYDVEKFGTVEEIDEKTISLIVNQCPGSEKTPS